jgi:exodeoxyribonuclease V alpha subunit
VDGKRTKQEYFYDVYLGDKVLRVENDYRNGEDQIVKDNPSIDPNQYNGDLSTIVGRDVKNTLIVKRIHDGSTTNIPFDDFDDAYKLGYAMTVHKAQGSQAKYVIIVMPKAPKYQWISSGRPLLYTAISRTREKCVIIGNLDVFMESYRHVPENINGFTLGLIDLE